MDKKICNGAVKTRILLIAMITIFAVYGIILANAQPAKAFPDGSYKGSCTLCTDDGKLLACKCRDSLGRMKLSTIDYSDCINGTVKNVNGSLTCKRQSQVNRQTESDEGGSNRSKGGGEESTHPDNQKPRS